jgi:hypothetical protein
MNTNNIRAGNFLPPKTTYEMDGLFKQEDIDNRHYIMGQCLSCKEWSQWDKRSGRWHCTYCGSDKYDMRGARSIRTWLATKHLKTTRTRKKQA